MTDTEKIHEFSAKNLLPEKYLLGELHGADLEDFERHMWECETCFESVKAGPAPPPKSWWQRIKEFFGGSNA
jgi:hypothetical protein